MEDKWRSMVCRCVIAVALGGAFLHGCAGERPEPAARGLPSPPAPAPALPEVVEFAFALQRDGRAMYGDWKAEGTVVDVGGSRIVYESDESGRSYLDFHIPEDLLPLALEPDEQFRARHRRPAPSSAGDFTLEMVRVSPDDASDAVLVLIAAQVSGMGARTQSFSAGFGGDVTVTQTLVYNAPAPGAQRSYHELPAQLTIGELVYDLQVGASTPFTFGRSDYALWLEESSYVVDTTGYADGNSHVLAYAVGPR